MKKVITIIHKIEFGFIGLCLAGMVAIIFLATFARYTALFSTPWAEEASRYLMVWLCFVGAGAVARTGSHFGIDAVTSRLPKAGKIICLAFQTLVVLAVCAWITKYGWDVMQTQIRMNRTSPSMGIPMYLVSACVPFCGISTGLQNTLHNISLFRSYIGASNEVVEDGGIEI